jgi:hypothetical protein
MGNLSRAQFRRLAQLGAQTRLQELQQEEAAIRAAFSELFGHERQVASNGGAPPRRRRMSAAGRKAVSERMRKYWAERRKANAGKNAGK